MQHCLTEFKQTHEYVTQWVTDRLIHSLPNSLTNTHGLILNSVTYLLTLLSSSIHGGYSHKDAVNIYVGYLAHYTKLLVFNVFVNKL